MSRSVLPTTMVTLIMFKWYMIVLDEPNDVKPYGLCDNGRLHFFLSD